MADDDRAGLVAQAAPAGGSMELSSMSTNPAIGEGSLGFVDDADDVESGGGGGGRLGGAQGAAAQGAVAQGAAAQGAAAQGAAHDTDADEEHRSAHRAATASICFDEEDLARSAGRGQFSTLAFEDLRVSVPLRKGSKAVGGKTLLTKTVVHGATGVIHAGELLAVMGPSGAGKSSFLDTLAGRKTVGTVSGTLALNGHTVTRKEMRQMSAYVAQEDTLMPTLTVRETFRFIADLQLHGTPERRAARVEKVLLALGLDGCAGTLVGGHGIRGISGGQRRRVSIGMELLTSVHILYLDEPTSGLDSAAALSLFKVLRKLARGSGTLVVATIHQPRSDIYAMFDQLMLMAQGHIAYQGPAVEAEPYFSSAGFRCRPGWNVADHLIDVIAAGAGKEAEAWAARFGGSARGAQLKQQLQASKAGVGGGSNTRLQPRTKRKKTSFAWQCVVLGRRCALDSVRNPLVVGQQVVGYVMAAVCLGLLFSQVKKNVQQQLSLSFAFVVAIIAIFCFFSVPIYVQGRALFAKEYASGYFRLPAYCAAQLLVQTTVNVAVVCAYTGILAKLQGWNTDGGGGGGGGGLWYFLSVNISFMLALVAINETIGSLNSNLFVALALSALVSVVFILFAGVICAYGNMPPYLRWLYWCSPCAYATSALIVHNFEGRPAAPASAGGGEGNPLDALTGNEYLAVFDSPLQSWQADVPGCLLLVWLVFRVVCFFSLRHLQKEKR